MPDTIEGTLFIIGAIFFLIGLIGGGMEVSAIKIPPIGRVARVLVFGMGTFLMGVGLFRLLSANAPLPATPTPENTPVIVTITPTFTETSIPPTATLALPSATPPPSETPTQAPRSASARIENIWVDYNVVQFGVDGMLIHVKFDVEGLQGVLCNAVAYFYYDNGDALVDHNGEFDTAIQTVAAYQDFTPVEASQEYADFELFMPYTELELPAGDYSLMFNVYLWDQSSDTALTNSVDVYFTITQE